MPGQDFRRLVIFLLSSLFLSLSSSRRCLPSLPYLTPRARARIFPCRRSTKVARRLKWARGRGGITAVSRSYLPRRGAFALRRRRPRGLRHRRVIIRTASAAGGMVGIPPRSRPGKTNLSLGGKAHPLTRHCVSRAAGRIDKPPAAGRGWTGTGAGRATTWEKFRDRGRRDSIGDLRRRGRRRER